MHGADYTASLAARGALIRCAISRCVRDRQQNRADTELAVADPERSARIRTRRPLPRAPRFRTLATTAPAQHGCDLAHRASPSPSSSRFHKRSIVIRSPAGVPHPRARGGDARARRGPRSACGSAEWRMYGMSAKLPATGAREICSASLSVPPAPHGEWTNGDPYRLPKRSPPRLARACARRINRYRIPPRRR